MAFDQRRFVFFESWRLTRGRGWRLFVIAAALVAIILAVELILVAPLTLAFAAGGGPEALAADPQPLARSAPWIAVGAAMLSLFVALIYAIGGAPWAEVYQQLRGPLASRPQT